MHRSFVIPAVRIALTCAMLGLAVGCQIPPSEAKNAAAVQDIVDSIVYYRDTRTTQPVCFGYFWEGRGFGTAATGGPAAFAVPCESVKNRLVNK